MAIKHFGNGEAVPEETDAEYSCTFRDAAVGAPAIASTAILTIVATLSDVDTGDIINGREDQNVLNLNGGTLATGGLFTLRFTGNVDMVIKGDPDKVGAMERHRLQLKVTYDRGGSLPTGYLKHEIWFYVINLKHDDPAANI